MVVTDNLQYSTVEQCVATGRLYDPGQVVVQCAAAEEALLFSQNLGGVWLSLVPLPAFAILVITLILPTMYVHQKGKVHIF